MKLLVVSYQFSDRDSTASLRPRAMAKYLPRHQVNVYPITCGDNRDAVRFDGAMVRVKDITRETVGRPLYFAWRIWQKGLRLLGFHRGELEYWRNMAIAKSEAIIRTIRPDAILASYPPAEALEIGLALSKKYGLPFIADFRDGLLFDPVEEERLRHVATGRHYRLLEAEVARSARLILTVSEPLSEHFRRVYGAANVMTLPNGFDPDDAADANVDLPAGVVNVVHTGRLGMSRMATSGPGRGIHALVQAVELMLNGHSPVASKLRLHFVGQLARAELRSIQPLVDRGVATVWGHLPRERALAFQRKADVLLLITAPDQPSIATGKLFEYLAANKPILALTRGTEAARIIRSTGAGTVVDPDDPEQVRRAIEPLLHHGATVNRNDAEVRRFSRDVQMAELAERLHQL